MNAPYLAPHLAECEKCGTTDIYTMYHEQGCKLPDCSCATCDYRSHERQHEEHLHYTCRTCHYDWVGQVKT